MNPNTFEQPGLSLPEPMPVGEVQTAPEARQPQQSPEIQSAPLGAPTVNPSQVPLSLPLVDHSQPQARAQSTVLGSVPMAADDADLIEKEWVSKAKEIVEKSKEDPHEQSREMSYLKADYLKKRYNKDIKVSEH